MCSLTLEGVLVCACTFITHTHTHTHTHTQTLRNYMENVYNKWEGIDFFFWEFVTVHRFHELTQLHGECQRSWKGARARDRAMAQGGQCSTQPSWRLYHWVLHQAHKRYCLSSVFFFRPSVFFFGQKTLSLGTASSTQEVVSVICFFFPANAALSHLEDSIIGYCIKHTRTVCLQYFQTKKIREHIP